MKQPHVMIRRCLGTLIMLFAVVGCSGLEQKPSFVDKSMEESLAQAKAEQRAETTSDVPAAVTDTLLAGQGAAAKTNPEPRFDIAVANVQAKTFFLGLVEGTNHNVVVHPELEGNISLELRNVTVAEVLEVTRNVYGYEYEHKGNIYTIYPRKLRTQIFQINYPDVQRRGYSETSVLVGKIQSENSRNSNGSGSRNNNANQKNNNADLSSGANIQTENTTDFWKSLKETLEAIVNQEEGGRTVMVTPQAGVVVVKALPSELQAVRKFLEESELSVKRQVILEAKILEVRLSDAYEAGINWGQIAGQLVYGRNVADGFSISTNGAATTASVDEYRDLTTNLLTNDGSGNPQVISIPGREKVDGTFAALLQVPDITKLLSLLETQGNVSVLSSPRISTVNNQKAVIRVGSDEFFVTGISSNTTANATSTTSSPNIELSSFFSGIALDVTPQIAENGEVILHIHPVISDVQDQLKNFTVGDEDFSIPLALRDIRESDSMVRAKSGQVVVLGGLMQESRTNTDGKRPLLGDIPIVNSLFKTKSQRRVKTELVILLRPVVANDQNLLNALDQTTQRFSELSQ